jgi:protoporphyrinogen oxidase
VGLEYFCQEGDNFWSASDADIIQIASNELRQIGYISAPSDVLDAVVVRISKAYPAYFGSYAEFPQLIDYFSQYPNLYLVGRNGMHKYNNMDHSMLTAMYAADLIKGIQHDKSSLWRINTEETYHESRETGKA